MEHTNEAAWPRWKSRAGLACIVALAPALAASALLKLGRAPTAMAGLVGTHGFSDGAVLVIGALELSCTVLFLVPRTAVLGALLLTGYFGGAIAIHVRRGESFVVPLGIGILMWAGLYLRHRGVRELLSLRNGALSTSGPSMQKGAMAEH